MFPDFMLIVNEAKAHFYKAKNIPYPEALKISPWWEAHQENVHEKIDLFETVEEIIRHAQSPISGFDHREINIPGYAAQLVNYKLDEIRFRFPHFDVDMGESPFSISESIVGNNLSSIFLTHLYFFLRTTSFCQEPLKTVLEIGSGYGGLARIFHSRSEAKYILVDLPESLFYAEIFLGVNFPDASFCYAVDAEHCDFHSDFIFVPIQVAEKVLNGQPVDLVINTGSFQEMTARSVLYWMKFIQETIETKALYSWNYFLNDKTRFPEAQENTSLMAPFLDAFWECRYFRINDPVLTIDCNQRNWLEIYVERNKGTTDSLKTRFQKLVETANGFPFATNQWFQNIFMAIWIHPEKKILDAMLDAIALFEKRRAPGILKCFDDEREFGETKFYRKNKEAVK